MSSNLIARSIGSKRRSLLRLFGFWGAAYPPNNRTQANAQFLHRDHLDSVRAITDGTGAVVERAIYKPFGEQTEWLTAAQSVPESKGWIGERFDADAGLQYLNARYYDPVLGPPQENDPPDHFLIFVDPPARLVRRDATRRGDQSVCLFVQ